MKLQFFFALLWATPALAQTPLLKAEAAIGGEIVTLGDLVENAGAKAATPLFKSPAPGQSGSIRTERILLAIQELGLDGLDPRGLAFVTVRRPSREASREEITQSLRAALARVEPALAEAPLKLDAMARPLTLDSIGSARFQSELTALDLKLERFEAKLTLPGSTEPLRVSGSVETQAPVAVLTKALLKGEPIQPGDLRVERRKPAEIATGSFTDPAKIAGLVARRALRPGQSIRAEDVVRPDIVEKNQLVTVHYDSGGMALALRGKALAGGIEGALIPVQNLQSKRTIEALVTGPGRVSARLEPSAKQ